ncbi:MAG: hypothetical protein HYX28_04355 [Candidatus Koribacter versatilis]|uniref:DUF3426 domain-containing protein n=1 Tax=Candidatus Korobacter versatilis TaxID=658062 RepID=A0A932A781_9BACT|nr:hypothetical protein [Candidatus Koribacter versatilis]
MAELDPLEGRPLENGVGREPVIHPPVVHRKGHFGWPLLALFAAAVLLVVIFVVIPTAPKVAAPAPRTETPAQPSADQFRLSRLKVMPSPARGEQVAVKLAGQLRNAGNSAVTGATVEATFSNGEGQRVFTQAQPIERITLQGNAEKKYTAFADSPLQPNDVAAFEVEFSGVPNTWDKKTPELRIVDVQTVVPTDAKPQPIATLENPVAPAASTDATPDSGKPSPVTPKRNRKGRK